MCTTVLHGGVCHHTSTPHKSGITMKEKKKTEVNTSMNADGRNIPPDIRAKSLTRTPLRIGVDIVKNIVEKHGCFVLVVN